MHSCIAVIGLIVLLAAGVAPQALYAYSDSGESEISEYYLEQSRDNKRVFQSAPIYHIVPEFNTVTYALALENRDILVAGKPAFAGDDDSRKLHLKGYGVSPYLALSLRNIGLGFNVEMGERSSSYAADDYSGSLQSGRMNYSALGVFLYLIPFPNMARQKNITITMITGARTYSAKHETTTIEWTSSVSPQARAVRYNVGRYEVGCNVGIQVFRNFSIIPWVDYVYTDKRTVASDADAEASRGLFTASNFRSELDLFWDDYPKFQYGLDFGAKLGNFEIHLGDLFGTVASYGQGADRVKDESVYLSVSFQQKGK